MNKKIYVKDLPFMNSSIDGLLDGTESNPEFWAGFNACLNIVKKQVNAAPYAVSNVPLTDAKLNGYYKIVYDHLYESIRHALGEDRYMAAAHEVYDSDNFSTVNVLLNAVETLREDAGDFDNLGLNRE